MGKKNNRDRKFCLKCEKEKNTNTGFYLSNSQNHADGRYPICKLCLKNSLSLNDMESIHNTLLEMNRPFIYSIWETSIDESKKGNKDLFGTYMKNLMLNNKSLTWKDSEFEDKAIDKESKLSEAEPLKISNEFINKWGEGYTDEEYRSFERKYELLKNNYQEKTAMHTEALLTYIRYRVKEELATAKGELKEASGWGDLANKAATAAKINPSQLSKSDLSDGLDTFGQLTRAVEQVEDVIEILPKYKERPQDRVDFTMWCYINYIRDMKGMPLAEYADIYNFYEERKKEYANKYEFLKEGDS